jgi:hypothetical protein
MGDIRNIDSTYVGIALLLAFIIGHLIVDRKKSLKLTLQFRLVFYIVVVGIIMLSLPTVFTGRFENVSDLETKTLLYNLKRDHEALARTTDGFHHLFFVTILFASLIVTPIIKHYKIDDSIK